MSCWHKCEVFPCPLCGRYRGMSGRDVDIGQLFAHECGPRQVGQDHAQTITPRRCEPARRSSETNDCQRLEGCGATGAPFGRSYWPGGRPSKNSSTSEVFTTSAYLA